MRDGYKCKTPGCKYTATSEFAGSKHKCKLLLASIEQNLKRSKLRQARAARPKQAHRLANGNQADDEWVSLPHCFAAMARPPDAHISRLTTIWPTTFPAPSVHNLLLSPLLP